MSTIEQALVHHVKPRGFMQRWFRGGRPITPTELIRTAVEQNADLEKIERLLDLKDRWEKSEAKKAFLAAMAEFKVDPPKVVNDMKNSQYGSSYSSLANLVNTVNDSMAPHGLNARWNVEQDKEIKVTCILSHVLGHSESVSLSGPPDNSGAKNDLQKIKSTVTYLKVSTFEAVTGVASYAANTDDDANSAIGTITESQLADINSLIEEVGASKEKFLEYLKIDDLTQIPVKSFKTCIAALEAKRKR